MPFPYSSQSHTATASVGPFSYSNVSLLTDVPVKDQIKVYLNGQLKTLTTDYTLTANETVTFNSAVTGTVKIARESDLDNKEVTFTNSSVLTAQDLNKNSDQLLFLCQELYDKAQNIAIASVGSVVDNAITEAKLDKSVGAEAVTTSTMRDGAVTEAKIVAGAVTESKIGAGAVTEAKILDGSVTVNKIGSNAVTETKILNTSVTPAKLSAGAPTWTGAGDVTISDDLTITSSLSVGTTATISGAASVAGNLSFNSGYGSAAVAYGCRAWLSFSIPNTSATYSRSGSTVTVTATSHGLSNGTYVYLDFTSGSLTVDGYYQISNVQANTFTVTDSSAGTTGGNATIRGVVRAAQNISKIEWTNAGNRWTITMANAMPDANYAIMVTPGGEVNNLPYGSFISSPAPTASAFTIESGNTVKRYDVAVFR